MKISELKSEEKDNLLEQASDLMKDYFAVKGNPKQVENLFNREIAEIISKLSR